MAAMHDITVNAPATIGSLIMNGDAALPGGGWDMVFAPGGEMVFTDSEEHCEDPTLEPTPKVTRERSREREHTTRMRCCSGE
jgi:hypothetical protein